MPNKDRKSNEKKRKSRGGYELGKISTLIIDTAIRFRKILGYSLLLIIAIVGGYIRYLPAKNFGLELDANDPWIAYWIADYFHKHGLLAFSGLRHVESFWWPVGRNFLATEFIGPSWLAAATYPIGSVFGLTLKEWIALFPVFAGVLTVVLAFYLVVRLTGSYTGGLVSASLFAVSPGAVSRTTVGFVEKTGIALPIILGAFILLDLAHKEVKPKNKLTYSLLAGIVAGTVAYFWGGVHIVTALLALYLIIYPLVIKGYDLEILKAHLVLTLGYIIVAGSYPKIGYNYFVSNIGVLMIYALFLNWIWIELRKRDYGKPEYFVSFLGTAYLGMVAIFSGALPLGGRVLAAFGIRRLSPLVESVQENQPASIGYIVNQYGVALILALLGIPLLAYIYYVRRHVNPIKTLIYISVLGLFYANLNLSYFTQFSSTISTIAAGIFVGDLVSLAFGEIEKTALSKKAKKSLKRGVDIARLGLKKARREVDPLPVIIAGSILLLVGASIALQFDTSYQVNSFHAPQILTSGLGPYRLSNGTTIVPLNDAWKNTLKYINESTPRDALIITWWDYGYWVTVNTGRKTMADGATLNETQIRYLARILTGNEDAASFLLYKIGAKPNETYILTYEIFSVYRPANSSRIYVFPVFNSPSNDVQEYLYKTYGYKIISHGGEDWPKSFQMLRIGRRVDPFVGTPYETNYSSLYGGIWRNFPGLVGQPQENVQLARSALIYRLLVNGAFQLTNPNVVYGGCYKLSNLLEGGTISFHINADGSGSFNINNQILPTQVMLHRFQVEKIFPGCAYSSPDGSYMQIVLVVLYKWTG
ncbi:MAG: hypothetical protein F7C32_00365 [Desulfurococcales archaeon]|nr:hypothetical protein [Desulfurococcales archaeon]